MRPTGRPSDSFIPRVRTRHPLRQVVRCLSEFSSQALRGTRIEWYPRRRPSIKKLSPAATEGDNAGLCWSSLESVPGAVLPAFFRTQRGYQPTVRLVVSDCGIIRQVAGARRFRPARAHPAGFAVSAKPLGSVRRRHGYLQVQIFAASHVEGASSSPRRLADNPSGRAPCALSVLRTTPGICPRLALASRPGAP